MSETPARLLVVDDEANQRRMLAGILSRAGYEVVTAEGGQQALAALAEARFDTLLTDQRMPGMDGLELLDRARSAQHDLPVVLMIGYSEGESSARLAELRPDAFVHKPFHPDLLIETLEALLEEDV